MTQPDRLHYIRLPKGFGGRAEMVRMAYVLAGKPYVDVLHDTSGWRAEVAGKNPFGQMPFIETPAGAIVYQTLAIMHHVGHGTPAWPADPARLTAALSVALGAYDLYQAFGAFRADDLPAKQRFEERSVPKYFDALGELYAARPFAAGDEPCFADCIAHAALTWCVRRNEVARARFEATPSLVAFRARFEEVPALRAFLARQAQARALDDAV